MTLREDAVKGLARWLPASERDTAREQWLADLEGARELGLRRSSVIFGAATLLINRRVQSLMRNVAENRATRFLIVAATAALAFAITAMLLPTAGALAVGSFVIMAGAVWVMRRTSPSVPRWMILTLIALIGLWFITTAALWSSWGTAFDLSDSGQATGAAGARVVPLFWAGCVEFIAIGSLVIVMLVRRSSRASRETASGSSEAPFGPAA
ncbi:hypothetical protein [Curtobacterium sp. MCPF17_031]|uniref:hypothetical protein n=1 Tax=Curtobacterium sp. MCPF17_031 TaxID=2175653 RepID=UPI000DA7FA83|nr:hypothetical protein [Curtobacterium sp. MCPF17_031]PZE34225.1 hypothetical protein DEJ31_15120 [Curtobacterium sp. MCPF17_031]